MIHFCPSINELPLKRQGLYCYLDLKVTITDLDIKVMYSKTAQIVLVEEPSATGGFMPHLEGASRFGLYVSTKRE